METSAFATKVSEAGRVIMVDGDVFCRYFSTFNALTSKIQEAHLACKEEDLGPRPAGLQAPTVRARFKNLQLNV